MFKARYQVVHETLVERFAELTRLCTLIEGDINSEEVGKSKAREELVRQVRALRGASAVVCWRLCERFRLERPQVQTYQVADELKRLMRRVVALIDIGADGLPEVREVQDRERRIGHGRKCDCRRCKAVRRTRAWREEKRAAMKARRDG